jgi:inorganic pyrophosphatase
LISGSVICCRPIGMLRMSDESGEDAKILAVPIDKLSDRYRKVYSTNDMPSGLLAQISHFFEHYKDLESGKWVKIEGWSGPDEALAEITTSIQRYETTPEKPAF